ncbi:PTS glucose transporter subunit IIA [Streptomyces sp. ME02-6979.5a]|uniref:PTS glucose transporter subunit IIA n=1 Tax=Streptomyces sp. ME02-6979.5a TaxID=462925 RepID=UPI0029B8D8CF|nr:PTS glucose transporter subunit IIA [Streptomyces sp. ME02-6979.5a]MDX3336822.1 PTS glucose transporter subunit IIA [Streptomyces sp. ME02-6979.5a]
MSRFVSRRAALAAVIAGAAAAGLPTGPVLALDRRAAAGRDSSAVAEEIYAPLSGEIVRIEDVPDVVFAEKIVGDGIAINPSAGTVVAPAAGIIGKIFETNHAFSMETESGLEVFVHVGIDTVELKGEGFRRVAEEGQRVSRGDVIIELDLEMLKEKAKSVLTPVVISNMDEVRELTKFSGQATAGHTAILRATKGASA